MPDTEILFRLEQTLLARKHADAGSSYVASLYAKGIDADYKVVALTEDSLNSMAQALGCVADAIDFDSYPEQ